MLQRLHKRAVQTGYAGGVSGTFAKALYVAVFGESKRTKGLTGGRTPENLSFTDKQKVVMRLLCEGYSKKAIADDMGLKPSSVKTHIDLIYKKLGVSSNVEAILKIEELGIFSEKLRGIIPANVDETAIKSERMSRH